MEFVYPQYLWLLAAVPPLMGLWAVGIWHQGRMRGRFGDLSNLHGISRVSWSGRAWLKGGVFGLSLLSMIVGLAYPQIMTRDIRPVPQATDIVFMLDISPSMFARDMDPHRLGRAEQIVQQFLLHKMPDDRCGLIAFNFNSVIYSYLTRDPQGILVYFDYLNRTTEPSLGTNMGSAMLSALRVFQADEQITPANRSRRRVLVLISDGDDNIGQWQDPLADLVNRHIKVYTFGLGTANGSVFPLILSPQGETLVYAMNSAGERLTSKAQSRTLHEVADRTGARMFRGEDDRQVQAAIDEILASGRPVAGYQANPIKRDLYFYFFSAAFICMLAGVFL